MSTTNAEAAPALKEAFQDDWCKFTEELDEVVVGAILDQVTAPNSEPHYSYKSSFVKACSEVAKSLSA